MRKTFVAISASTLVALGAAGCVSKSEDTKTVQAAEARYSALEAENARLPAHPGARRRAEGARGEGSTRDRSRSSRALNVARYLQKQGIEPASLSAAAFGEFKPVANNATLEGRARNRRIEIVLVPKE